MHPVAKRCLLWAIGLALAGTLFMAFGTNIVFGFTNFVGPTGVLAVYPFAFIAQLVTSFAMPLAAVLVGAAIVIQTLAPKGVGNLTAQKDDAESENAAD